MSVQDVSGIDVRRTSGGKLVLRAALKDAYGSLVTSGTTNVYLYELQDDGTLKSFDWNDNTFKTTALTTEVATATHRQGNNSATNTGVWTKALTTVTGFTVGGVYMVVFSNTQASPPRQEREFQFGGTQGDPVLTTGKVNDGSATTTVFVTTLTGYGDDFFNDGFLLFTSGALAGQSRKIADYTSSSGSVTLSAAATSAPANGVNFVILGRSE